MHSPSTVAISAREQCAPYGCIGVCDGGGCGESALGGCRLVRQIDAAKMMWPHLDAEAAGQRLTSLCRHGTSSPPVITAELPKDNQRWSGTTKILEWRSLVLWVRHRYSVARATGRWPRRPLLAHIDLPGLRREAPPPPMPNQLALLRSMRGSIRKPFNTTAHHQAYGKEYDSDD